MYTFESRVLNTNGKVEIVKFIITLIAIHSRPNQSNALIFKFLWIGRRIILNIIMNFTPECQIDYAVIVEKIYCTLSPRKNPW